MHTGAAAFALRPYVSHRYATSMSCRKQPTHASRTRAIIGTHAHAFMHRSCAQFSDGFSHARVRRAKGLDCDNVRIVVVHVDLHAIPSSACVRPFCVHEKRACARMRVYGCACARVRVLERVRVRHGRVRELDGAETTRPARRSMGCHTRPPSTPGRRRCCSRRDVALRMQPTMKCTAC